MNGSAQPEPQRNNSGTIGAGSYVVNVDPDMEVAQQFATTAVRNGFVRKVRMLLLALDDPQIIQTSSTLPFSTRLVAQCDIQGQGYPQQ